MASGNKQLNPKGDSEVEIRRALAETRRANPTGAAGGDLTGTYPNPTVATDAIDVTKMANMAQDTIRGRQSGSGTGDPEDLTKAQTLLILNVEDGADVTDTTNVNAAGATMNADTTMAGNSYFLDEDAMGSDDATKVASQQSIKAYVDSATAAPAAHAASHTDGSDDIQDATSGQKGLATATQITKLDGIAASATANPNAIDNVVEDTTPQLGGTLSSNSKQIQWSKGADVASAGALTLGTDGNIFDITGTTTITSIATLAAGTVVKLHFDGILALTHHATNLILPTGANITTAAGDEAEFYEYGAGTWRCNVYTRAAGTALAGAGGLSNVVEDTTPQLGGQLDVNGQAIGDGTNELLTFVEDASAVNNLEVENQATGAGPILRATGDDTNVDLHLDTKGSGNIKADDDLDVTGDITVTGTVDGRDVATDGAKLDGIATSATANPNAIDNVVEDASPQLGGTLDTNSKQIQWSKGSDVASAGALTLGTDGNVFDITGTTTITSIATLAIGTVVVLQFDGILTFTHHATDLVLPTGANITTAAGDHAVMAEYAAGDWRCIAYTKADGTALAGAGGLSNVVEDTTPESGGVHSMNSLKGLATAAQITKLDGIAASATANPNAIDNVVEDTTPQLGGPLDSNSQQIRWSKGSDVASAGALTLGTDGNYFDITGTTTITSIGTLAVGTLVKLHFDGILTLTHHATDLVLPTAANITTAAGDEAEFVEYATGDWRCTVYTRADGSALVAGTHAASHTDGSDDIQDATAGQKGVMTAAAMTKLDGIEAAADVTDATNVDAAGAVMEGDTTTASMSFVIDEDSMASDLDTKVPTQQSVKAYADTLLPLAGGQITGNITMAGAETVDGRDVSVDGTKLDGIETSATADQTGAEIKTAYEGEADTNAFTDAEQTKLSGIEASADVTDNTNVNAAGATMNADTDVSGNSYVLDEDTLSSDSATKLATQQSIKAYVDDRAAAQTRNLLINGAMRVAQRSTSETGRTVQGYWTVDRFEQTIFNLGTWTVSQETDAPDGFGNSLKMACTTADASPAASDILAVSQSLEGQNLQHLLKGTSDAKKLTLSFWVKSNVTGTYTAELLDHDNTRYNGISFTIDVSNTWEKKTLSFDGDTTGSLDSDINNSFMLYIWLGAGSNFTSGTFASNAWHTTAADRVHGSQANLGSSNTNTFFMTGLQLEVGETATDFEELSYAFQEMLCMRYYQFYVFTSFHGDTRAAANHRALSHHTHLVPLRASPTITTEGTWQYYDNGSWNNGNANFAASNVQRFFVGVNVGSNGSPASGGTSWHLSMNGGIAHFDAEL